MKINRLHNIINTCLIVIGLLSICIYLNYKEKTPKVGYVDNFVLFNGFNMTKDISLNEEEKMKQRSKELDSLYIYYQSLDANKELEKRQALEIELNSKTNEFRKLQEDFSNYLSRTIWQRLNQYSKEYAKTHKYDLIIGSNGDGNVLFSQKSIDITQKFLEYSNTTYEGKLTFNGKK